MSTFLSPQQVRILKLLAEDNPCKKVAEILGVAPQTVSVHKHNLSKKLGVITSIGLYKKAVELGVVPAPMRKVL